MGQRWQNKSSRARARADWRSLTICFVIFVESDDHKIIKVESKDLVVIFAESDNHFVIKVESKEPFNNFCGV